MPHRAEGPFDVTAGTAVHGSPGYVAVERVTGTLHGRRGSFALQHSGTMNRGSPGPAAAGSPGPAG